jgi:hypothetical protein
MMCAVFWRWQQMQSSDERLVFNRGVTYGLQIDVAGVACMNWVLPEVHQYRVIATPMFQ